MLLNSTIWRLSVASCSSVKPLTTTASSARPGGGPSGTGSVPSWRGCPRAAPPASAAGGAPWWPLICAGGGKSTAQPARTACVTACAARARGAASVAAAFKPRTAPAAPRARQQAHLLSTLGLRSTAPPCEEPAAALTRARPRSRCADCEQTPITLAGGAKAVISRRRAPPAGGRRLATRARSYRCAVLLAERCQGASLAQASKTRGVERRRERCAAGKDLQVALARASRGCAAAMAKPLSVLVAVKKCVDYATKIRVLPDRSVRACACFSQLRALTCCVRRAWISKA